MIPRRPPRANTPSLWFIYLSGAAFAAIVTAGLTLNWWWPL